jgi:ribosomal protein S18 acetylase RimI-like enzyme
MTDNAIADDIAATQAEGVRIRPLERTDLDAVVAVDQDLSGRSRRGFFARRLDHAARDPAAFAAFAAERDARFVGFVFARIEEGEFGATARQASLDAIGVDLALAGGQGVGRVLLSHLVANLRARGISTLATQVEWTDHRLLGFFSRTGFVLAPRIVLERGAGEPVPGGAWSTGNADEAQAEDATFESLPRDRLPVRSMAREDLAALVAIDRRVTGQDRPAYYARKLDEVFSESGVRMSLVADIDGHPAGFIMARVDFGEFGHTEPEAVMDTIGVDPRHSHEGVATALLSQLTANLGALRAESLRTEVSWNRFDLLGFLDRMGFRPHRRLALRLGLDRY